MGAKIIQLSQARFKNSKESNPPKSDLERFLDKEPVEPAYVPWDIKKSDVIVLATCFAILLTFAIYFILEALALV